MFSNDFSYFPFALIFVFLLYAGLIALGFWILYQVIWRAVRRGLRDFHNPPQR